ncbi:MAG TPA: hypothetical protein DCS87_12385 [Rheinheimera sp.]|nr:hypothetical protein [Rheinheimera sp.]
MPAGAVSLASVASNVQLAKFRRAWPCQTQPERTVRSIGSATPLTANRIAPRNNAAITEDKVRVMTDISIAAPVRMLLADDHQIFRDGLKMLLQLLPNLQLVAELDSLTELRNSVKATEPQLLLLDFHMPGGETSAEIDYLKQRYPSLKVIVLTGSQSPTVLKQLDLVNADGILQKNGDATELKAAIDAVLNQQRYIAPRVLQLISESTVELTAREFEVLKLVCDGLSNAQIAEQMHLSPKTTDKHRENLMRKLDVNNAPQLIKKALQLGLLDSSC